MMKRTDHRWMLLWLLGPLSTAAVYVVYACYSQTPGYWPPVTTRQPWIISRQTLETLALVLLGLAWLVWVLGMFKRRDLLVWLIGIGLTLLLAREWHFEGSPFASRASELGIYGGLPTLFVLGVAYRERIAASTVWQKVRPWLVAAVVTYVYSVIVSRRAFRFLPHEEGMHIPMEEVAEIVAHSLTLCMALVGNFQLVRSKTTEQKHTEN